MEMARKIQPRFPFPGACHYCGDRKPKKTGMDMFQEEGTIGYQHACAAAIQNMLLSAHALGLGSLWFTLFDKAPMRMILDIPEEKTPIALVCIGKPAGDVQPVPRKSLEKVVRYIR